MRVGDKAFVNELVKLLDRRAEDREKKRSAKAGIAVVATAADSDQNYTLYLSGSGNPASGGFKTVSGLVVNVGDTVSYTIDGQNRHITALLLGNTPPKSTWNPNEGWMSFTNGEVPSSPPPTGGFYYYYKDGKPYYMDDTGTEYSATGFTWKGQWVTSTAYAVNDTVEHNGSAYMCVTSHTSSASTEPGVGASWDTYWDYMAQQGADGADGSDGAPGADGTDGATWHSGSGAPSGGLGEIGDYYLDNDTGQVYEKTGASTWTTTTKFPDPPALPPSVPTNLELTPVTDGFNNLIAASYPNVWFKFDAEAAYQLDAMGNFDMTSTAGTRTYDTGGLITGDPTSTGWTTTGSAREQAGLTSSYIVNNITEEVTSMVLVRLDTLPTSSYSMYLARQNDGGATFGFSITGGKWRFALDATGGSRTADSTTSVATDTLYLLVGTYDGTYARIYVNGVLEDTSSSTSGSINYDTPDNYWLGVWENGAEDPVVEAGSHVLWDRALPGSFAKTLWESLNQTPAEPDTVSLEASWTDSATSVQQYTLQYERAYEGTVDFTATASGSGGSLAAGDYTVAVSGVANGGENAPPQADWQTVTLAAGERLYVNITDLPVTVASYNIYAGLVDTDEGPLYHANTTTTGSNVEITARGTGDLPLDLSTLITYDNPVTVYTTEKTHTITGLLGGVWYGARVKVTDEWNQSSAYTSTTLQRTGQDSNVPDIPTGLVLNTGYRMIGARWNAQNTRDLDYYEVRYSPDNGSSAPDDDEWAYLRTPSNWIMVDGLDAGTAEQPNDQTTYYFQVRAVDTSGNASDWSNQSGDYASAWPSIITTADIAYNSIIAGHVSASGIEAEKITSGTITIGGSGNPNSDLLLVYDSTGQEIGRWDNTGLTITDPGEPNKVIEMIDGILRFSNDSGTTWGTAIDSTGVKADSILSGNMPGGVNQVPNSSLELADFVTTNTKTWTSASDWQGHLASDNVNWDDSADPADLSDSTY